MNLSLLCGPPDSTSIFQTYGQGFFHHYVDAVAGTDFDHLAMVIGVGVDEHGLRMNLLQHFFQTGKQQVAIDSVAACVPQE